MVSLLVEIIVGALIVVGGWYFISGGTLSSLTGSAVGSAKKKSKSASKADDKQAANESRPDTEPGKKVVSDLKAPADIKTQKTKRAQPTPQPTRSDLDTADFPALSSSDAKKSTAAQQKPAESYAATAKQSVPAKQQPNDKAKTQKMTPLRVTEQQDSSEESDDPASPVQTLNIKAASPKFAHEQEDDDWHVVKPTGAATIRIPASRTSIGSATSQAVPKSIPGLTERSKKQRQNDAKRAAEKAEREEAEKQRLQLLAQHRRQQEREKAKAASPAPRSSKPQQPSGQRQNLSGGMTAKVTQSGLIWE